MQSNRAPADSWIEKGHFCSTIPRLLAGSPSQLPSSHWQHTGRLPWTARKSALAALIREFLIGPLAGPSAASSDEYSGPNSILRPALIHFCPAAGPSASGRSRPFAGPGWTASPTRMPAKGLSLRRERQQTRRERRGARMLMRWDLDKTRTLC
jgi:hypothetical protein